MAGNASRWSTAPLAQSKPDCCGLVRRTASVNNLLARNI
ncbi:hypothetical protein HDC93_007564 [Streptomyces sp. AK010]|nr:hypothetical protein [Streptomyces sp. AK010]